MQISNKTKLCKNKVKKEEDIKIKLKEQKIIFKRKISLFI